jgi:hypothetical protein
MARGDEGESVKEIRALLLKFWLLALSSSGEEYHGLGERQSNICGCCASAILRHFPQPRDPFYLLYADFADGLRSIQINGAVFKPGLRVGHARALSWPMLDPASSRLSRYIDPMQKEAPADQTRARLTRGLPASASSPLQGSLALL